MPTYNEIMSTMPSGPSFGGGYGGGSRRFSDVMNEYSGLYDEVVNANNGLSGLNNQQGTQGQAAGLNGLAGTDQAQNARQMNTLEQILKGTEETGMKLTGLTGWDVEKGFQPENVMRFIAGLPTMMVGGVMEAPAQYYEAFTGNPLLDADLESNLIGTEKLNSLKRMASGGNAIINSAMPLVGASARGIGVAADIATGGRIGSSMSKGWIAQAMKNPYNAVAGQIAFDTGVESGEEFTQSYLDDIRHDTLGEDSLNRAITAAKWGALGGGVMSGTVQGINYARGKSPLNNTQETTDDKGSNDMDTVDVDPNLFAELRNAAEPGGLEYMPYTNQVMTEQASERTRRADGAVTLKQSSTDPTLYYDQMDFGDGGVRSMYEYSSKSREKLAGSFRVSEQELADAIYNRRYNGQQYGTSREALQAIKDAKYGNEPMVVAVGRNPDTKNGGFYLEVRNIVDGNGIIVHRSVAPLIGTDFDGDQSTVYLDWKRYNMIGYPTEMGRDPEASRTSKAASVWDNDFTMFLDKGRSRADIEDIMTRALGNYASGSNLVKKYTDQFMHVQNMKHGSLATDEEINARNTAMADMLENMRKEVGRVSGNTREGRMAINRFEGELSDRFGTKIVDATRSFAGMPQATIDRIFFSESKVKPEVLEDIFGKNPNLQRLDNMITENDGLPDFYKRGTLGMYSKPAQVMGYINGLWCSINGKGNPMFRDNAFFLYDAKDHRAFMDLAKELHSIVQDQSVFNAVIRASFKMAASGHAPATAIEGFLDAMVKTDTMLAFGESKIRSKSDIDEFFRLYKENFNKMVDVYTEAEKVLTTDGFKLPYDFAYKNKLEGGMDAPFARTFIKTMGGIPIDLLFDSRLLPERYRGLTLEQFLEPLARRGIHASTQLLVLGDDSIQDFVDFLAKNMHTENGVLGGRVESFLESDDIDKIASRIRYDEDGNMVVDPNDQAVLAAYADALACGMDPNNALKAGMYGVRFFGTKLGKMLISPHKAERKNAFYAIAYNTVFEDVENGLRSEDDEVRVRAWEEANRLATISTVHSMIVSQLLNKSKVDKTPFGHSSFLDYMRSIDISFDRKTREFDTLKKTEDGLDDTSDLRLDILMTADSSFDLSRVSDRLRKAESALERGRKALYENDVKDISDLETMVNSFPIEPAQFVSWFVNQLMSSKANFNLKLLGHEVWTSAHLLKEGADKGVVQSSAAFRFQSMEQIVNGGQASFINDAMSSPLGVVTMDEFCSNRQYICNVLSNENYYIWVEDPISGESVKMDRNTLIRTAKEDWNGGELTKEAIFAVLKKYPQLAGWISTPSPQPMMRDGVATVTQGRTGTLCDSFNDFVKTHDSLKSGGKDPAIVALVRDAKNILGNELLNQTWYIGFLLRCVSRQNDIDAIIGDHAAVCKAMIDMHNRCVNAFLYRATMAPNGVNIADANRNMINDFTNQSIRDLVHLVDVAGANMTAMMQSSRSRENVKNIISVNVSNSMFALEVENALRGGKKGFSYTIPQTDIFGSLIEEQQNRVDAATAEYSEMVDTLQQIYSLMAHIYDGQDIDVHQPWEPDFSYINDLEAMYNNAIDNDTSLDDNQKASRKAKVKKAIEDTRLKTVDLFVNSHALDSLVFDDTDRTFDQIKKKVMKIIDATGKYRGVDNISNGEWKMGIKQQTELELKQIFSEKDVSKREKKIKEFKIVWNNQLFADALQQLSNKSGEAINQNLYKAQLETNRNVVDFIENNARQSLDALRVRISSPEELEKYIGETDMPIPKFTDRTTETLVQNMWIMDNAGFVPSTVNINGSMTKKLMGFGFLEHDVISKVPPTQITVAEAKKLLAENSRYKVTFVPNGTGAKMSDIRTLGGIRGQLATMQDTDLLWFYDPKMNPHGIDDSHTPAAYSRDPYNYKRASGIYLRLMAWSQEGMVLKAKKGLKGKATIATKRGSRYFTDDSTVQVVDPSTLADPITAKQKMQDVLVNFRDEFADNLVKVFNESASDLGFDEEQGLIIAQTLTPGFTVTFDDGSMATIDATHIFLDQSDFNARWAELTGSGKQIVAVSVLSVSPQMASFRAMRAVSTAAKVPDAKAGDIRHEAQNAMSNWDDFVPGRLSVEKVMGNYANVGFSYDGSLALEGSRTPMQFLQDEVFDSNSGAYLEQFKYNEIETETYKSDDRRITAAKQVSRYLSDPKYMPVKVFLGKSSLKEFAYTENARSLLRNLVYDGVDRSSSGKPLTIENGCAIVVSDNDADLIAAKEWSVQTGMPVFVPVQSVARMNLHSLAITNEQIEITPKEFGPLQNKKFVKVWPNRSENYYRQAASMPTASRRTQYPEQIYGMLVDLENWYELGDAEGMATEMLLGLKTRENGGTKYKLDSLLGKTLLKTDIARPDALSALREQIRNGDWSSVEFKYAVDNKKMKDVYQSEITRFLDEVQTGNINGSGVLSKGAVQGGVVAMVTDGKKFAPVYLPRTAPRDLSNVSVVQDGDTIEVRWDGFAGFLGAQDSMKMNPFGEASKMTVKIDTLKRLRPYLMNQDGTQKQMLEMVISPEGNRLIGMESQRLAIDLYYFFKKFGGSLLLEKNADGTVKFKDELRGDNDSNVPYLIEMVNNTWNNGWDLVLSGEMKLAQSDMANMAIRNVVRWCKIHNVAPMDIFTTFLYDSSMRAYDTNTDTDFMMAFQGLREAELFALFHAIDPMFCPDPSISGSQTNTYINLKGHTFCQPREDRPAGYYPVRWGPAPVIGDLSGTTMPGGTAMYGWQHVYSRGLEKGYLDSEYADVIKYVDFQLGDPQGLMKKGLPKHPSDKGFASYTNKETGEIESGEAVPFSFDELATDSIKEIQYKLQRNRIARHRHQMRTITKNGEILQNPEEDEVLAPAINRFREFFGEQWTFRMINIEAARQTAYAWNPTGDNSVDVNTLAKAIDAVIDNTKEHGLPIMCRTVVGQTIDSRYTLARLSQDEIDWFWDEGRGRVAEHWGTKAEFEAALKKNAEEEYKRTENIPKGHASQKKMLDLLYDYDYSEYGGESPVSRIYGDIWTSDIANADNLLAAALRGSSISIDPELFNRLSANERQHLADIKNRADKNPRIKYFRVEDGPGGARAKIQTEDGKTITALLDSATECTKVMALINPGVLISNMLDRSVHQGIMNFAMHLGHILHVGPYTTTHWMDQNIVTNAVNNELFLELYAAYRMAAFTGEELEFLSAVQSEADIRTWLADRRSKMTPLQRAADRVYDLSSGGNFLLKGQMRNFLNRFVMFAEQAEGQDFWFEKRGDGRMRIEEALDNPGKWFLEVLGANGGNTASLTIALQSMNSAKTGDMAQRNVISMMFSDIARRHPACKFLVTTTISRFPQYSLNVTGRMLNWVLPMSSINYVFTQRLAEHAHRKAAASVGSMNEYVDPHYEDAQIHASLREAMLVDVTHLGMGAVMAILVGMSGGIEPPEDEKKWGNISEWTVCGLRVGEAWWMQDILGIALPMACFTKAAQLGNPRIDTMVNGVTEACYNNPVIRVADAVGFMLDPEGRFFTDYENDRLKYEKAKDGAPGLTDWMQANAMSFGLSWVSQFFTPSMVREWYANAQQYEVSYKRVYEESETGILTEGGALGDTMYTTYGDAMLRRTTRRNPILGWLCDMVLHPNTGYLWSEMPRTVYVDDAQYDAMENWSIVGLDQYETQAKLLDIIKEMQKYDDMGELAKTGFFLDTETKAALSSVIWDTVYEYDQWWSQLKIDGKLDYYVLGEGDWAAGQAIAEQLYQDKEKMKSAWVDFYYNKVKSPELSQKMVKYNRYNTTYAQDVDGNWYATGYRPQGVLPFISAPGRKSDPENTAGYENDWTTVSAVTGLPMDERALIPVENEYVDWPDLEEWSGDGQGNGYSKMFSDTYANYGDGTGSSGTGGRASSYGGGYRRSGGGGGGSSRPNIYSRYSSPNMSAPRIMGRVNREKPDLDYLRPAFETKGSREAYRREDI